METTAFGKALEKAQEGIRQELHLAARTTSAEHHPDPDVPLYCKCGYPWSSEHFADAFVKDFGL